MRYRIGLDIGIASVGWCALECDEWGEPLRILDLGVRVFDSAEQPKTGASLALPRREARCLRRRLRRRAHRLDRVRSLCARTFGKDVTAEADECREDIFSIRYKGLAEKLQPRELTKVLIYFAKHRGFLSNRKSELKKSDMGALLNAVNGNKKYMAEKNYRTIGEMIYRDERFFEWKDGRKIYRTRNREGDYSNTFYREDLKEEIKLILDKQKEFGVVNAAFVEKYLEIFSSQRSFDEGPAAPSPFRMENYPVALCPFEKATGERCAPKASFTFEYFSALQKINNLKIYLNGIERELSESERTALYAEAKTKKNLDFARVKKLLSLPPEASFNLLTYSSGKKRKDGKEATQEETEKKSYLFKMERSYSIRSVLSEENTKNIPLLDEIALILSHCKSDERRRARFENSAVCAVLSAEEKERLIELEFSGFGGLSVKAMQKILPYLEQGYKYSDACEKAGYDFRMRNIGVEKMKQLRGKEIREMVEGIAVPVVRRAVSQTVKVINALVIRYGSPCAVNIELARELSKDYDQRSKILKENVVREKEREEILERLRSEFHLNNPKGRDALTLRLYEEQGGKCAYSGEKIEVERLFESNYVQVDHIIPYSRSFDDSYSNKALVLSAENQNKKDRTPYEYFGNDTEKWGRFETFVNTVYQRKDNQTRKKKENLLRVSYSEENEKEWKSRNLNDTRYISRFIYNLVNDYLCMDPIEGKKKQVTAVNGKITAYLRNIWGLSKVREDGDRHHALDASVIACVTDGAIHKITEYNKIKERNGTWDREKGKYLYPDPDGELLESKEYDKKYGYKKDCYEGFREELLFRLMNDPKEFLSSHLTLLQRLGYSDEEIDNLTPIFVSRMPDRKADGPIHKETIRSARSIEQGVSASKTPLTGLKLTGDRSAIEGYDEKAKKDDRLLYEALYARLLQFDGDGEKAFAEPFYKPTSDGRQGNLVKKVWITDSFNTGVRLNEKAVAENGGMVRTDVFYKDGKYYCVPVYIKDIYAKHLPDRAITAHKNYSEWTKIDDSFEFLFALFPNDLIYLKSKKAITLSPSNSKEKQKTSVAEGLFYYKCINSATGAAKIITHDNSYEAEAYFKTSLQLKKYTVDILGEKHEVRKEKRLNTEWDS